MIRILVAVLFGFFGFQPGQETTPIEFDGVHLEYPSHFEGEGFHWLESMESETYTPQSSSPEHVQFSFSEDDVSQGRIKIVEREKDAELRETFVDYAGSEGLPVEALEFDVQEIDGERIIGTRALTFFTGDPRYCYLINPPELMYRYEGQSKDKRFKVYASFTIPQDLIEEIEYPELEYDIEDSAFMETCTKHSAAYRAQWEAIEPDNLPPILAELDLMLSTLQFDDDALSEMHIAQKELDDYYREKGLLTYQIGGMSITIPMSVTDNVGRLISPEGYDEGLRWDKGERSGEIAVYGWPWDDFLSEDENEQIGLLQEILRTQPEEPELPSLFAPADKKYHDFHYVSIPEGQGIAYLVEDAEGTTYHFFGFTGAPYGSYIRASIPVTTLDETPIDLLDGILQSITLPCC